MINHTITLFIKITSSDYFIISYNFIVNNTKIVQGCGISLDNCFSFLINNNFISNLYLRNWSYGGITLKDSKHDGEDQGIYGNNIEFFSYGIRQDASTCIIENNRIANNLEGIECNGIRSRLNIKKNNIINNQISIYLSMCGGSIHNNNIISDSDIYILKQLGWTVSASRNYWGQEVAFLWPRRYISPLFALVRVFPWRTKPVDITQCWPE